MQHCSDWGANRITSNEQPDALHQGLMDQTEHALIATNLKGIITFFNKGAEMMLGHQASDLVGRPAADILLRAGDPWSETQSVQDPGGVPPGFDFIAAQLRRTGAWSGKAILLRKDGSQLTVQLSASVMLDRAGLPSGYLCIPERIPENRALESDLEKSRDLLNATLEAMPHPTYLKDSKGVFINCNSRFAEFIGIARECIIGRRAGGLDSPEPTCLEALIDRDQAYPASLAGKKMVRRAGSASAILFFREEALIDNLGHEFGVVGNILDITGQTRIEEELQHKAAMLEEEIAKHLRVERELKQSEERLSVIFEASQAGIVMVAPDGTIDFANQRMAEMFGVSLEELLGSRYENWLHPSDRSDGEAMTEKLITGAISAVTVERHYTRRDGSDFWGYLSGRRMINGDGSLCALIGTIADVTELRSSQNALKREKDRLTVTLSSIGDGVITVDTEGRVTLLNRAAEDLCGCRQQEAAGLPLDQVFHVVDERTRVPKQNSIARALESGEVIEQSGHDLLISRDGSERIIVAKTAPILDYDHQIPGAVLVFSDITERREIEEELFKARKLESLGILAGGIAHDFNNLLTGIMGNISLSRANIPDGHSAATFLDRARKGAEQSKDLTLQLLTFSKGGAPIKKLTSISQVLMDSAIFALRGSNVRCEFDIDPHLWCAEVDTGQLSQVISNLVINADQAMPGGGSIVIRAENVLPLDENDHGRRIRITFKDTGTGISEQDLSRIYDPYFSTKATGNGLGLATVYAIIRNHDGEIRVFSRPEHGTTFAITLPAQQGSAPQQSQSAARAQAAEEVAGGRILLMDDEDSIREMATAALSMFGYHPVVAREGDEMLKLYREALLAGIPFDAVIMDLTVPGGMGGKEAVKKLLELDPQARAIASSGYSADPVMANYLEYGFAGIVSKPYSLQDLDSTLKEILAKGRH